MFPIVCVEVDRTVCIDIMCISKIICRNNFFYIPFVDMTVKSHFVHKTDGAVRTAKLNIQKVAVFAERYIVGHNRNESSRNSEGYGLFSGFDIMSYLNSGIHHIGVVFDTEIAVGLNCIYGIRVGNIRYAILIEAEEFVVRISIPTDIVRIIVCVIKTNLSVFIGKADKSSRFVIICKTNSLSNRCHHFVTKLGGVIKGSKISATCYEIGGKVCT